MYRGTTTDADFGSGMVRPVTAAGDLAARFTDGKQSRRLKEGAQRCR